MGETPIIDIGDPFKRPLIADETKRQITEALSALPEGKKGALLILVDENGARAHVAARYGEHWKVAAGAGRRWNGPITAGVAVEGSW